MVKWMNVVFRFTEPGIPENHPTVFRLRYQTVCDLVGSYSDSTEITGCGNLFCNECRSADCCLMDRQGGSEAPVFPT